MTLRMHGTVLGLWGSLALLASGSVFAGANDNWYTGASCQQTGVVGSLVDEAKREVNYIGFLSWYGPRANFLCPTNQNRGMTTGYVTPWVEVFDGTSTAADVSCSVYYVNGQSNYYAARIDTLKSGLTGKHLLRFPTVSWYHPYWSHYTINCSLPAGSPSSGWATISLYGVEYTAP